MGFHRLFALSFAVFAASISTSLAGPCSGDIDRMQARIDAKLQANAAAGPTARESTAATMHRQPTPESIAAAEARLGELSDQTIGAIAQAMTQARAADAAGDGSTCEQALANIRRVIGQ